MIKREEIEGSKYSHIFERGLPDKELEFFWNGFRDSIINSIKNSYTSKDIPVNISELVLNKLELTREVLNNLHEEEKYSQIPDHIEKFIVWIGRHFMIHYGDSYHFGIYNTNIKRWARWILKIKEGSKLSYEWMKKNNNDHFTIFFELKSHLIVKNKNQKNLSEIESELIKKVNKYKPENASHNLSLLREIMEYLVDSDYLKPQLLELLDSVCPVIDYLKKKDRLDNDLDTRKPCSIGKLVKKYLKPKSV